MAKQTLREYKVRFERVESPPDAGAEVDCGLRTKLGGEPDWEQEAEFPDCPHCSNQMVFVGQLDSIEHDWHTNPHRIDSLSGDQHYMFGDVGLVYIFFCFDCTEARAVVQCG